MIISSHSLQLTLVVDSRLGHDGPVGISESVPNHSLTNLIIQAAGEIGIPENRSYNSGDNQGN